MHNHVCNTHQVLSQDGQRPLPDVALLCVSWIKRVSGKGREGGLG